VRQRLEGFDMAVRRVESSQRQGFQSSVKLPSHR
jgi:hypothetical protein